MKNFFLIVFLISFSQSYSQVAEGQAVYELKVNLHKRLKPEDEKLKEMMPEFKTQKMQLLFNKYESYYKEFEDEDDDIQPNPGSGRMRFMSPKNELYRNYKTKRKVDLKEFFGEKFRIEDTITPKGWKITNETKKHYIISNHIFIMCISFLFLRRKRKSLDGTPTCHTDRR